MTDIWTYTGSGRLGLLVLTVLYLRIGETTARFYCMLNAMVAVLETPKIILVLRFGSEPPTSGWLDVRLMHQCAIVPACCPVATSPPRYHHAAAVCVYRFDHQCFSVSTISRGTTYSRTINR